MLNCVNCKYIKRILSVIVAMAVFVSSLVLTQLNSSADTEFKHRSKVYAANFSSGDTLEDWIVTAPDKVVVSNGVFKLSPSSGGTSYSSVILRPDTEKYINQQLRVDYKCDGNTNTTGPVVWLRATLLDENDESSLVGYYAKPGVAGSINKYEICKRYFDNQTNTYNDIMICRAGRIFPSEASPLGVELNVSGTNPTVITCRTFKNGKISQSAVAVDNEPSLQCAGNAGVSAFKTPSTSVKSVDILSIVYDSADKVSKGYYAMEKGTTVGRFSTMLSVYQDREYVFFAKSYNAEEYEPLFVRYDTDAKSSNNANSSIIDLDMATISKNTEGDITTHSYNFKISDITGYTKTTNTYFLDSNNDCQVPIFVGVDLKNSSLNGNQYFGFELKEVIRDINDADVDGDYDEIIEYGPNLIANGDFKYGLSGWSDHYHSTTQTLDWGSLCGTTSLVSDGVTTGGLISLFQKSSGDSNKKIGLFNYSADFSNSEVLSDWVTTSLSNVNLEENMLYISAKEENRSYSSLVMRPDTEMYLNNTVRLDYKVSEKASPVVWARANIDNPNFIATTTGYFVKTNLSLNKKATAELYKRYLNSEKNYVEEKIMNCGTSVTANLNSTFSVEMVTEGTNPTVITVRSYIDDMLISSNVTTDSEASLQAEGSAAIAVYGAKNETVALKDFNFSSSDYVVNDYYVEQIKSSSTSDIFGQQISVEKSKKYTLSATIKEDEKYQPFYIAYKDKDGKAIEKIINIEDCTFISENGLKTYTCSIDFSKLDFTDYVSEDYRIYVRDGKAVVEKDLIPVIVGIKFNQPKQKGNKYSAFGFRETLSDGSFGPNLLSNAKFKSGLLGWGYFIDDKLFDECSRISKVNDMSCADGKLELKVADNGLASMFGTSISYVADFNSSEGWVFPSSNAEIKDGKLTLNGTIEKNHYLKNSAFFNEKKLNQLVITEFYTETDKQKNLNQLVWARANLMDESDISTLVGYYAKFNTHSALEVYKRSLNSDGEYEDILLGKAGNSYSFADSRVRRVEIAVEGNYPTKISASVYKEGDPAGSNADIPRLMGKNVFFDNEDELQDVGIAGTSIELKELGSNNSLDITKFEYHSSDGEIIENAYIEKPSTTKGRTNKNDSFGQILAVNPNETYVVEALVSRENVGLWIDYKNGSATTNTQTILLNNYGNLKENENGQRIMTYEFNLTEWANNNGKPLPFNESNFTNGRTALTLITFGFNINHSQNVQYAKLKIYAKNDLERKNLLTNADFNMGLYGWLENCGSNAYISCFCSEYKNSSTLTATNKLNLLHTHISDFEDIFNVQEDEFIFDYENYTGKYMLHLKDNATFDLGQIGNMIELETGKTYVYSVKYKYIITNSVRPRAFCFKDDIDPAKSSNADGRITLGWDVEEKAENNSTMIFEFHIPEDAYIYDADGNRAEEGKAKVFITVSTGFRGADCYFTDFMVYDKEDPNKTNLLGENADFSQGYKNWILAKGYDVKNVINEKRWTVAAYPTELLPYDPTIFINDSNDNFWNDGDWASKFGPDDPVPQKENTNIESDDFSDTLLENDDTSKDGTNNKQTIIRRKKKVVVTNVNNPLPYIIIGCVAFVVVACAIITTIIIIKKRRKKVLKLKD